MRTGLPNGRIETAMPIRIVVVRWAIAAAMTAGDGIDP